MTRRVKLTIQADVDPSEETTLYVKPFGPLLAEKNQMFARAAGQEPKRTNVVTVSATGQEHSPDDDDVAYDFE